MASSYALITWTPLSKPNSIPTSTKKLITTAELLLTSNNRTLIFSSLHLFECHHKYRIHCGRGNKFYWNYGENFSLLSAFSSSNTNWVDFEVEPKEEYNGDEFIVVNFYRFVFVNDPQQDLSKHLSFMQYSGPSRDALAYVEWVKEDHSISISFDFIFFFSQLEEGISHLPLLEPSMRATPLTPSEWRARLETVNTIDNSSNTVEKNCILLDVRNGYEWDVGHFQGAQRPDVECFRSTSFGLSDSEAEAEAEAGPSSSVVASDPLANVDREKTDILMYCTGGIRCDVYSTILRQQGFKRLYTLKGGVSHYLENEGSSGWVGNLFVFDGRLSLPPSTYNPQISSSRKQQEVSHSFAKCYICTSQVSELRHRNCANLDCNLLFLCCMECVNGFKGCCCTTCTSASRLRPLLPGHQRYQKWHTYRDVELQGS
ncbi:hypothetical protein BUALT_Bualt02G0132000 [Buddleja alternifolia]|uniref:Rhodanese domain-containing protein n=1 Tax=Buddleja alternifolia TaxID=168488 RepID=A0AAV6Y0D4_9LAMI|nr:hypothetical protein BUALT_Bualt02G0132000 [Buddleja alternifolia]